MALSAVESFQGFELQNIEGSLSAPQALQGFADHAMLLWLGQRHKLFAVGIDGEFRLAAVSLQQLGERGDDARALDVLERIQFQRGAAFARHPLFDLPDQVADGFLLLGRGHGDDRVVLGVQGDLHFRPSL